MTDHIEYPTLKACSPCPTPTFTSLLRAQGWLKRLIVVDLGCLLAVMGDVADFAFRDSSVAVSYTSSVCFHSYGSKLSYS